MKKALPLTSTSLLCVTSLLAIGACQSDNNVGTPGRDSLVELSAEAAGSNCEFGGQRIDAGLDDGLDAEGNEAGEAGDGILDEGEITLTSYLCKGDSGDNGDNGDPGDPGNDGHELLVVTTDVAPDPAATDGVDGCTEGGKFVETGLDDGLDASEDAAGSADDGLLDAGEVDSSFYVCNGVDGDAMHAISGTVAPGDYISLDVSGGAAAELSYYAQVVVNGQVMDHAAYSALSNPVHTHKSIGPAGVNDFKAVRLDNGNLAIVLRWYDELMDNDRTFGYVYDPAGAQVGSEVELPEYVGVDWYESSAAITKLSNGNIVFVAGDLSTYAIYDESFATQSTGTLTGLSAQDRRALAPSATGFAYFYGDSDDVDNYNRAYIELYDASGTSLGAASTVEDYAFSGAIAVHARADGNFNVGAEIDPEGDLIGGSVHAMIISPEGAIVSDQTLTNTYSYNMGMGVAPNGNWILGFELGGPDAAAYAVLDDNGAIVHDTMVYSDHEPTEMAAGAFTDGSFSVLHLDDDSLVGVSQAVRNDGSRASVPTIFTGGEAPGYDAPYMEGLGANEMLVIYDGYDADDALSYSTVARGYLELRLESATEARLYNYTADTLDVLLSAD